jgi:hypothetical protein
MKPGGELIFQSFQTLRIREFSSNEFVSPF